MSEKWTFLGGAIAMTQAAPKLLDQGFSGWCNGDIHGAIGW
ncbi:MAG: hypothetical protein PUP92_05730 [Rhizonema sp. PD38]|nr:hypothetical protein [Rhizonema sp. PD38]